jgi:hypothetical protein
MHLVHAGLIDLIREKERRNYLGRKICLTALGRNQDK